MNHKKIYNIDKKFCFRVSLIYFASVLFANFMAKLIPISVDLPVVHTDDMLKWKSFLDSNEILINAITVAVFLLPSIICLSYSFSILFAKDDLTVAKKVINIPIKFSLLGFAGWFLYFLAEVLFSLYAKSKFNRNINYFFCNS